jgi:putative membrane protein
MMGFGWGMGFFGWIFMGLFWVGIAILAGWVILALVPGIRARTETPEEILDRRFALGELDAEQYQRVSEELAAAQAARR